MDIFFKVILSSCVHVVTCTRMLLNEVGPGSDNFSGGSGFIPGSAENYLGQAA